MIFFDDLSNTEEDLSGIYSKMVFSKSIKKKNIHKTIEKILS